MKHIRSALCLGSIALASIASAQTYVAAGNLAGATVNWSGTIVLEGIVIVPAGTTLNIAAGTIVRGQPRSGAGTFDPGTLVVAPGGRISANGSVSNPIVFTTAAVDNDENGVPDGAAPFHTRAAGVNPKFWDSNPKGAPRSANVVNTWGGVIILGNAPTNVDADGTVGLPYARPQIEGLPPAPVGEFGGVLANDNSGIFRYVSIRHGGANLSDNNEINGLTLGGVGNGTTVEYVEIWGNEDDGLEIFGGTVNVRYILVVAPGDDGLDFDFGWTGTIQFAAVIAGNRTDTLCEWDGDMLADGATVLNQTKVNREPVASYSAANLTLIGYPGSDRVNNGIRIRDAAAPRILNSILLNPKGYGLRFDRHIGAANPLDSYDVLSRWNAGQLTINSLTAFNCPTLLSSDAVGTNVFTLGSLRNVITNPGILAITYSAEKLPQNLNPVPNRLGAGGNVGAHSNTTAAPANLGLSSTSFRGAFPTSNQAVLWTSGWSASSGYGLLVNSSGT